MFMDTKIPNGTVLHLGQKLRSMPRRDLLRLSSFTVSSGFGIRSLIQETYGKKPEGKAIVHTGDIHGNSDKVKIIPQKRYRRINVYNNMKLKKFSNINGLQSISILQETPNPSSISIVFDIKKNSKTLEKDIPNNYNGIPIKYKRKSVNLNKEEFEGGRSIDNPNKAGNVDGTICLIAYKKYSDSQRIITADHVMEGANEMKFAGDTIGTFDTRDRSVDTTSYSVSSGVETDPLGTVDSRIPNISGVWRSAGLVDKVGNTDDGDSISDGETVDVKMFGALSGYVEDICNNTKRSFGQVSYQADMRDHKTTDGDSGGPWVDSNGKLLALHHGYASYNGNKWSVGVVGKPALDAVQVSLSK